MNDRVMEEINKPKECFKTWVNNVELGGPTFNHLVYAFKQNSRQDLVETMEKKMGFRRNEIEAVAARKVSTSFCFNSGGEDCFE